MFYQNTSTFAKVIWREFRELRYDLSPISNFIIKYLIMRNLITQDWQFTKVDKLMWMVTKLLAKKKKMILDEFDLTCSQFDILAAIYQQSKHNDEIIQISLSEITQIDPMTTSTILRNLQKRGLIKRERGLVNTRTVEVELTQSGKDLYNQSQQKIEKMKHDIYHSVDERQFTSILLTLTDRLNKINY